MRAEADRGRAALRSQGGWLADGGHGGAQGVEAPMVGAACWYVGARERLGMVIKAEHKGGWGW